MKKQAVLAAVLLPIASIGIGFGIYASGIGRADDGAGHVDTIDTSGGPGDVVQTGMITKQLYDAIEAAKIDLATRGVNAERVALLSSEAAEWPDASMGVPEPGTSYAQVVTPGFKFFLHDSASQFEYHSDAEGKRVVFANETSLPAGFVPGLQNF